MRRPTLAASLAAALFPGMGWGQVPVGPEFQINTYTTGDQADPHLASDAAGNFVVTWSSYPQDGSSYGVYAQRYDAAATPLDLTEFRVNTVTLGAQSSPVVAAAPDGRLRFAWRTQFQDGSGSGIYSRLFDAFGAPDGDEFVVNTYTTGGQTRPAISADVTGNFVVVWNHFRQPDGSERAVLGQRFAASGAAQGSEFMVNSYTTGILSVTANAVASSADGGFVVVWSSFSGQDGSGSGVFAQRFDASGMPAGPEFRVNDYTTSSQGSASVASDPDGNFVVVWTSYKQPGGDGVDVFGRRYDAAGVPQGPEFIVNNQTIGRQDLPSVTLDPHGNFVVVWNGPGPAQDYDVFGRAFNSAGPITADFPLGTRVAGARRPPAIASNAAGDFVVAWVSNDVPGSFGIFARQFRGDLIFADGFESGDLSAWSASEPDGGDLSVNAAAAMDATLTGLGGLVDDTAALYVQDDSPHDEPRYRARFWIDPNGFDPGVAQGHLRTRVFIAFTEEPSRRVAAILLRLQSGVYSLMGRARLDDDGQADTGFFAISDGPHAVELFIDGVSMIQLTGLDNSLGAVDLVRMGALSAKSGATGTIYWDEFESRRQTFIGP